MTYTVLLEIRPEFLTEDDVDHSEEDIHFVRTVELPFMPAKGHTLCFTEEVTHEGEPADRYEVVVSRYHVTKGTVSCFCMNWALGKFDSEADLLAWASAHGWELGDGE
jgi:hypothetical protein